ncbi:TolC family protein [Ahrensia kielensis]|uniref:TolC family protein n=1 Tax=Ahrensia kielensis TaxID=76980 RepID=A0ABU9T2U9_9HYPH
MMDKGSRDKPSKGGCLTSSVLVVMSLAIASCVNATTSELMTISPELGTQNASAPLRVRDVAKEPNLTPIVVSTLNSQAAIVEAAEQVRVRFANVEEAKAQYFPQVSVGVASNLIGSGSASPQLTLKGSQMLYDFGRTDRGVSRDVHQAQLAHLSFLDAVDSDLTEMLRLLAEFESQSKQLKLGNDRLARMVELGNLVKRRSAEGVMDGNDLIEAKRRVQTAETLLIRAKLALSSSSRDIESETGVDIGSSESGLDIASLTCGEDPIKFDTLTSVQRAAMELRVAKLDAKNAETERMPTLSLEASTSYDLSNASNNNSGMTLRLEGALFRGGAVKSRIKAASRSVSAAEASLRGARSEAQRDQARALDAVKTQKVITKALLSQSALLDETRKLYLNQFLELGTKTIDDVLDAEEEYHQNLLDIELTRKELAIEKINCLAAEGRTRRFLGVENSFLHGLALKQ